PTRGPHRRVPVLLAAARSVRSLRVSAQGGRRDDAIGARRLSGRAHALDDGHHRRRDDEPGREESPRGDAAPGDSLPANGVGFCVRPGACDGEAVRTPTMLEIQCPACRLFLANMVNESESGGTMNRLRTLFHKHRCWLLVAVVAAAIGYPTEAQTPDAPRWLLGKAYHVPSEFTNQESGYFSIIEGKNGRLYIGC